MPYFRIGEDGYPKESVIFTRARSTELQGQVASGGTVQEHGPEGQGRDQEV
jgi:hypothetical protein